ncbi:MAG: hypothetical protein Q7R82_01765 [Candidatus Daviesbacteria bacterium]|nr:hypothetical protein [Candidatus Daviesbacteria bacterium]
MLTGCEFSPFPVRDIRAEDVLVARFGLMASCSPSVLIEYGGLAGQLEQTQHSLDTASRSLDSVNRYFDLQAAGLIGRPEPASMLVRLCESGKLPLAEIDLSKEAIALAELSGALFCVVTDREVWLTPQGENFYHRIIQHQSTSSSRKS